MTHTLAGGQTIQVFGRKDSRDTQKALRFFKERRTAISFVDLDHKPLAPAELRRFAARFSARALFDESSRSYRDAGLAYLSLDDDQALERLLRDQSLLKLPLVRIGAHVSVGPDERAWKEGLLQATK